MKPMLILALTLYYLLLGLFYSAFAGSLNGAAIDADLGFNSTTLSNENVSSLPKFTTGIGGFFVFATFGVGLPDDTPDFIQTLFTAWSVIISLITLIVLVDLIIDIINVIQGFIP